MSKFTLILEDDYNFDLLGLCSHQRDYRVCWAVNKQLGLNLEKSDEPFMVSNKKGEILSTHSLYVYHDEELSYYFIQNKGERGYLVPERAQIDYFLVMRESGIMDLQTLVQELKEISEIQAAYIIEIKELKSVNRFIF
ncbi:MAG TPA: IPExxxVDY family protein [Brumimicrobium sp.]|nr:IPExxxVDY family protein [Brumimicrobium sp.]